MLIIFDLKNNNTSSAREISQCNKTSLFFVLFFAFKYSDSIQLIGLTPVDPVRYKMNGFSQHEIVADLM